MLAHYQQHFQQAQQRLQESDLQPWLKDLQQQHFAAFESQGFPDHRDEQWKYTSVKAISKTNFAMLTPTQQNAKLQARPAELADVADMAELDAHEIIFVNGQLQRFADPGDNFRCSTLLEAGDAIKPYLNQSTAKLNNGFAHLNSAFLEQGIFLEIIGTVSKPIHIIHVTTAENTMHHLRQVIVARPHAKAHIVETYRAHDSQVYFNNVITECYLEPEAKICVNKCQQEASKAFHIASTQVQQQQNSEFHSMVLNLGGRLARSDLNIELQGPGASCEANGLYIARGRQHLDQHTRIDHRVPHCQSNELYKGIVDDQARAVFNGLVYVHPQAKLTQSALMNKNLLLSPKAEVDTKPELEIYHDDVKCSHGATVGQLDEQQYFYLRSRGLQADVARSILTYAFCCDVLSHSKHDAVKHYCQQMLLQQMPEASMIQELLS